MDPLKKSIEDTKDLTPDSVNSAWKADGTGFRSGEVEPNWNPNSDRRVNTTDTEDREIIWTNAGPMTHYVYLVVDEGNLYKPYLDRFFVFTNPADAIAKVKILLPEQDKLLTTVPMSKDPVELTPEMLVPGHRFMFRSEHIEVYVIAIQLIGWFK